MLPHVAVRLPQRIRVKKLYPLCNCSDYPHDRNGCAGRVFFIPYTNARPEAPWNRQHQTP